MYIFADSYGLPFIVVSGGGSGRGYVYGKSGSSGDGYGYDVGEFEFFGHYVDSSGAGLCHESQEDVLTLLELIAHAN